MNKLFVSAGLLAAGAASIQTVSAQSLDLISPNAWSVSGTLRGFYDSNYATSSEKKGSFGFEATPSVSYNLPTQQTDMGIRYTYGLYYYQERQNLGQNPIDQTHEVDLWLDHAVNERWHINATDTFASGQEPELLTPGLAGGQPVPFRVSGNNIANHAQAKLDTQWTPELGTSLHYNNDFYWYDNHGAIDENTGTAGTGPAPNPAPFPGNTPGQPNAYYVFSNNGGSASLAGLLNRVEQNFGADVNWTFSPELKVFVGYSFGLVNYIGNEPIAFDNFIVNEPGGVTLNKSIVFNSASRDFFSHNVYAGLNYQLLANLVLQGTVGAEYIDSYNNPLEDTTSWSPTANISLSYTYNPGSYVQVGVSQGENSTDVIQPAANGSLTQYQYTTVFYADINHQLTSKLMASLIGRYAYSTYEGGAYSTDADDDFNFDANLSYQISRHFSAEVGYNYDDLSSDVPGRAYTRNRVYIGVGANY